MIFHRVIPLFLSALAPLTAAEFPNVPGSDRVLTTMEVKNFWVNHLHNQPLAPEPTRLHPEKAEARSHEITRRRELIKAIRAGQHDLAARLVCLSHNVEAWTRQGDTGKAHESERQLLLVREHVAKMAALEAQREAAVKIGNAAEQVAQMDAELQRLQQLQTQLVQE
ncbi:hypothetical protein [Haloferula sp. BvORR071]|uniref:hypothetical protein n=1 Tax=Haloferula sp. BvORR071 TaxID=1396141 RepID=UPI00054F87F0|nr:hypothetical protein [Haloferula sp. BvORR071]